MQSLQMLCKHDIIKVDLSKFCGEKPRRMLKMTSKKVEPKKILRTLIAGIVLVGTILLGAYLPILQTAKCEISDNTLIVERKNPYNTSVVVEVIEIDTNGNVEEERMRIHFEEGEENIEYNQEYFKKVLETENDVFVKGLSDRSLDFISYYTPAVTVLMVVVMILMLGSMFYFFFKFMRMF